jgi:hypothetical protein
MTTLKTKRKPKPIPGTGLVHGQASKIARIHRLSVQHVIEVARGNRPADAKLQRTIDEYRARNAAQMQSTQAVA